ncbi:MAG: hypothetical protein FWH38_09655 [Treponema sp.]|nr:hypothetical protein [Treponema sp.]
MGVQGKVITLTRYAAKGMLGEIVQSSIFLERLGMEGDFHACGGEQQISLLSLKDRQWMDLRTDAGLCFGRYKENLLFDGIDPEALTQGVRLKTGEAVLEISDVVKHCFNKCPLYSCDQNCFLAGRNLFAKVLSGGQVRTGDRIEQEDP